MRSKGKNKKHQHSWGYRFALFTDTFLYLLGPVLILFALGIIVCLVRIFIKVLLPLHLAASRYTSPEDDETLRLEGFHNDSIMSLEHTQSSSSSSSSAPIRTPAIIMQSLDTLPNTHTTYLIAVYHCTVAMLVVFNICYNYYYCVRTKHTGRDYEAVIQQLATETGQSLDRSTLQQFKEAYEYRMSERRRARGEEELFLCDDAQENTHSSSTTTNTNNNNKTKKRTKSSLLLPSLKPNWTLQGPTEWGYCYNTRRHKPPRSHYDYVTKALILNMDHYCPWMFNVVGYFNYRYFVNFLLWVMIAMVYCVSISYKPFWKFDSQEYRFQVTMSKRFFFPPPPNDDNQNASHHTTTTTTTTIQHLLPFVPTPEDRQYIGLFFLLSGAVMFSVGILFSFHCYLVLHGQTTIEFNATGFRACRRLNNKLRKRGGRRRTTTKYDLGYRNNIRMVYGSYSLLSMIWPSNRKPEFLPVPISGVLVRMKYSTSYYNDQHPNNNEIDQHHQQQRLGGGNDDNDSHVINVPLQMTTTTTTAEHHYCSCDNSDETSEQTRMLLLSNRNKGTASATTLVENESSPV